MFYLWLPLSRSIYPLFCLPSRPHWSSSIGFFEWSFFWLDFEGSSESVDWFPQAHRNWLLYGIFLGWGLHFQECMGSLGSSDWSMFHRFLRIHGFLDQWNVLGFNPKPHVRLFHCESIRTFLWSYKGSLWFWGFHDFLSIMIMSIQGLLFLSDPSMIGFLTMILRIGCFYEEDERPMTSIMDLNESKQIRMESNSLFRNCACIGEQVWIRKIW